MLGEKQNVAFDDLAKLHQLGLVKCFVFGYRCLCLEKRSNAHTLWILIRLAVVSSVVSQTCTER